MRVGIVELLLRARWAGRVSAGRIGNKTCWRVDFVRPLSSDATSSDGKESDSSESGGRHSRSRLFRVARPYRKTHTYDDDKIDGLRAMADFGLEEKHLTDLAPVRAPTSPAGSSRPNTLYLLTDVYHKAIKVHGSDAALDAHRRPLVDIKHEDAERSQLRMSGAPVKTGTKGANRVVAIAFTLNFCDCLMKFGAAYLTGSKSLFAEAIHSTMDTANQLILLLGIRYSEKHADPQFPYGYGNARYVTSLISGCGILSFGCGLSMYHGISGLLHPAALEPLHYGFYALFISLCFQGTSALTAFREVRKKAREANVSILNYVNSSADPSLNVVLLEDVAAVTGVMIALGCITLSSVLESPIPDSVGSILIGLLLGTVASFIIRSNAAHLVGRSLPKRVTDDIVSRLQRDTAIRSVHDVKATALGVEQSRFKAELDFDGRAITRTYLQKQDMTAMLQEVKGLQNETELAGWMEVHGEKVIDQLGDEIDRIEGEITRRHPDVRHVDLEAL